MCIIVQQNRFQASLQSQEVSWFGSTRTWVYLSYTNRSRVVLYLRARSESVCENHPPPPPRGKATGGRKAPLFGVSCWWENYWWFAFLCVGIVVPCLSNGLTDFFDLLFCFFIYERSPEISTIYLISLMRIVQRQFRRENNWNIFKNIHNLLLWGSDWVHHKRRLSYSYQIKTAMYLIVPHFHF